ncbi:hypothetical protein ABL78_4888 [Leptomonas seymouri]|uniref:Signal recognition particle receptor subunit beta n=1 Tax=Leptomonas seymouri TaxID=5684 RepID=A0A0N1I2X6_LEPSE|nr:hypothetical protein ABL78_4888 [Leptomonas seymouri]|eukprot:KPI86050.1 hypothetical protein ABL78_4888 [Leptomonas seymouri]
MSELYTGLVNETVVEAARVALEHYAAEHHTGSEARVLPGMITSAEEDVLQKAVLVGLHNLCRVQSTITTGSIHELNEGVSVNGDVQATNMAKADAAALLREGMLRLLHNATALQDVVQQVVTRIRTHLGSSNQLGTRHPEAVVSIYGAAPEVTLVLESAVEQQLLWKDSLAAASSRATATPYPSDFSAVQWVWLSAALVLGYLVVRLVFGRALGLGAVFSRRRRTKTVLIGLPDSGKTALFGQLVRHMQLRETRTSTRENTGPLLAAKKRGMPDTAPGVSIVDCPGHPRLRERMLRAVGEAVNVVVVIDAVSVQDSQHDGVAALAELLLGVLQSPEFYGVQRLLFSCTKRDEVTSYASKAVRKLLEAAMVASIESRQNAMGRVESVRDSSNTVITSRNRKSGRGGGTGRHFVLSVEGGDGVGSAGAGGHHDITRSHLRGAAAVAAGGAVDGGKRFSFEQLGIPFSFVDVSSRPHPTEHMYSVTPVEEFILAG